MFDGEVGRIKWQIEKARDQMIKLETRAQLASSDSDFEMALRKIEEQTRLITQLHSELFGTASFWSSRSKPPVKSEYDAPDIVRLRAQRAARLAAAQPGVDATSEKPIDVPSTPTDSSLEEKIVTALPIEQLEQPASGEPMSHVITDADDHRQHLRELLRISQRRLQVLELQKRQQGGQTPPHIVTEIEDLQGEVAKLAAQLDAATPTLTRTQQRQTRADAFRAFLRKDWQQTEDLAAQVVEVNTSDQQARQWFDTARRALGAAALYGVLQELKDEGNWQAVLEGKEAYEREYPDAPDNGNIWRWAEGKRRYQQLYEHGRELRKRGDWQAILEQFGILETHINSVDDPDLLWQWAKNQGQGYNVRRTYYGLIINTLEAIIQKASPVSPEHTTHIDELDVDTSFLAESGFGPS